MQKPEIEKEVAELVRDVEAGCLPFFDQLREPRIVEVTPEIARFDMAMPKARQKQSRRDVENVRPMPAEKAPPRDDGAVVSQHELNFYRSIEISPCKKSLAIPQNELRRFQPTLQGFLPRLLTLRTLAHGYTSVQ
jgi:hypothetical protein